MYRCIKPDAKELYDSDPQKHIELCGRICYKSEDRITEESNKKFISDMHGRNHWAMLEHFRFIAIVPPHIHGFIKSIGSPYIVTTVDEITHDNGERDLRHMVSASARALMDAVTEVEEWRDNGLDGMKQSVLVALMAFIKHIVYHYGCAELFGGQYSPCQQYNISIVERDELRNGKFTQYEIFHHEWHTVLFTVDRGIVHAPLHRNPRGTATTLWVSSTVLLVLSAHLSLRTALRATSCGRSACIISTRCTSRWPVLASSLSGHGQFSHNPLRPIW